MYIYIYDVNLHRVFIYNNRDNVSNIVCITMYIKAHSPIRYYVRRVVRDCI